MNGILWVVVLVGMFAVAILWGYWLTRRRIGYLWACYAATVAWVGALLVGLGLNGSPHTAALLGAALVVALPFLFIRDKRRVLTGQQSERR